MVKSSKKVVIAPPRNLVNLQIAPSGSRIIYHYCNSDALWSIVEGGKIWLSDIFALNDSVELKWGRSIFLQVFLDAPDLLDDDFKNFAIGMVLDIHANTRPFVGSFSANGDLLSQWRAYADDGRGFSLGLSASHIYNRWGVGLRKVEYRETIQKRMVTQSLIELQDVWRRTGGPSCMRPSYMMAWAQVLGEFAIDLSCLKHPSFFEEKEFRAIRALIHSEGKFLDVGAGSRGDAVSVKARTRGSNEIAYIEFPIDANHEGTVVRNVIIDRGMMQPWIWSRAASKKQNFATSS